MPPRDPMKLPTLWRRLDTLYAAMKKSEKKPLVGLTQGGSSRKDAGCRPAAHHADIQKRQRGYDGR